jgi:hypothetical protein
MINRISMKRFYPDIGAQRNAASRNRNAFTEGIGFRNKASPIIDWGVPKWNK